MTTTLTLGGVEWEVAVDTDVLLSLREQRGDGVTRGDLSFWIWYDDPSSPHSWWMLRALCSGGNGLDMLDYRRRYPTRAAALAAAEVVIPTLIKLLEVTG